MADQKISQLNRLTGSQVDNANDVLPIVDASADETKAISRAELMKNIPDATFSGSTSGIDYNDLENLPPSGETPNDSTVTIVAGTGLTGGGSFTLNQETPAEITLNALGGGDSVERYYDTRQQFVSDLGNHTYTAGDIIFAGGVPYVYDGVTTDLPSLPGFDWFMSITPLHYGALGDGTADDSAALQALVDSLSRSTGFAAINNDAKRVVDLLGRKYLMSSPVYIGRFDFNQDGVFEIESGSINNVKFVNGRFIADSSATWTEAWPGQIGKFLFYVGVVVNTGYVGYAGENRFEVLNIQFQNIGFDCGFVTGGVWVENSYRTVIEQNIFYDLGVGCTFVGSPQTVGSTRGYQAINQQLLILYNRFEGNLRADGVDATPGKVAFNNGQEITLAQDSVVGSLQINGAHTSGGKYTSPTGDPYFVEIANAYEGSSVDYHDFSDVNFTITGFADVAETIPVSETMQGPIGGAKVRWAYSTEKYAVITSITSDAAVSGVRSQIDISTSYKNSGLDLGTHDSEVEGNNFTHLNFSAILRGRACSFRLNHPWAREVLLTDNVRKNDISHNYLDYVDVNDYGRENVYVGNRFILGNTDLSIFAPTADALGESIAVVGNVFSGKSKVRFTSEGGNSWSLTPSYTLVGNTRDEGGNTGYNYFPGFTEFGRAVEVRGFFETFAPAKFGGDVNINSFSLLNSSVVEFIEHSSEPSASSGAIAISDGTSSTNGFGSSGAGLYRKSGTTWTLLEGGGGSLPTDPTFNSVTVGPTVIESSGYFTGGAGGEFNGYFTGLAGGEFNGGLQMNVNAINGIRNAVLVEHPSEPAGTNGSIANSNGTPSTNGFGVAGAGFYRKSGGQWSAVDTSQETLKVLSGTSPSVDFKEATTFEITTSGNTTFSFVSPPNGHTYGFSVDVTMGGTHTLAFPASVAWIGGAPSTPASGVTASYVFYTKNGGVKWTGVKVGEES